MGTGAFRPRLKVTGVSTALSKRVVSRALSGTRSVMLTFNEHARTPRSLCGRCSTEEGSLQWRIGGWGEGKIGGRQIRGADFQVNLS